VVANARGETMSRVANRYGSTRITATTREVTPARVRGFSFSARLPILWLGIIPFKASLRWSVRIMAYLLCPALPPTG
jgi:hypothetical protein